MQPTTLAPSAPMTSSDSGRPPRPSQPARAPQTLTTNIVNNIPVHAPIQQPAQPVNEEDELDKIMQDVGRQLKQAERHTPKKRLFSFRHKAKPIPPQPHAALPVPAPIADVKPAPVHKPDTPKSVPAAAVKPGRPPMMIMILTLAVTTALIAAAIYAYRLS
ncbi:MAG TPA: hypothetical protein VFJ84_00705 [Candidatus Saccharimonadales bacterium]|nr:hypothetical protein [Candidatus Saccharimonadales bacterium]